MARPRPNFPTRHPNLAVQQTDDGSLTLSRLNDQETYHSSSGALAETQHVYLENSGIAARLQAGVASSVLEVGLGTGMAMLVALDTAIAGGAALEYVALEHDWLSRDLLGTLKPHRWVKDDSLARRFLQWRGEIPERPAEETYRWQVDKLRQLRVVVGDATRWQSETPHHFDAIFFDPFAPPKHPQLWSATIFRTMAAALHPQGRLTTYCVSRAVRDAMAEAGLVVQRVAGPVGGKRNVLIATLRSTPAIAEPADCDRSSTTAEDWR